MEKIKYDPPRPSVSAETARRAAEKFVETYAFSWLICGASQRPDRIVDDLTDAVIRLDSTVPDGYRLALELDKLPHWYLSADAVETLHNMRLFVCDEVGRAQKIWAQENDIRPPYPLGTKVVYRFGSLKKSGTIVGLSERVAASYLVAADGEHRPEFLISVAYEQIELIHPKDKINDPILIRRQSLPRKADVRTPDRTAWENTLVYIFERLKR